MSVTIGWIMLGLAGLIAGVNFYLSFVRYLIYRVLGREYRFVSGMPILGSLFAVLGLSCVGYTWQAWVAVVAIAIFDTCGVPWFLVVAWHDQSFWDAFKKR